MNLSKSGSEREASDDASLSLLRLRRSSVVCLLAAFGGTRDERRGSLSSRRWGSDGLVFFAASTLQRSYASTLHLPREVERCEFAEESEGLAVVGFRRFDRVVVVADVLGGSVAADAGLVLVAVVLPLD